MDLTEAAELIRKAAGEGLANAAEVVKQAAIELTPIDTGELRNSAGTAQEGLEAVVYFDAEHAPIVHEDLTAYHVEGQAKFLEVAAEETKETVAKVIAAAIEAVL